MHCEDCQQRNYGLRQHGIMTRLRSRPATVAVEIPITAFGVELRPPFYVPVCEWHCHNYIDTTRVVELEGA